ncbi:hypothetical protein Goshw_003947 [Gossypium schwendimanii]|uniref:Uncharacterized protein n=1 Tax=Gossypium schwendimanii TaxID=34291 RepID=A0A7J9MZS9_GOSSC|nr:hypothetical protein [Gossypium schwendimanii]
MEEPVRAVSSGAAPAEWWGRTYCKSVCRH